MRPGIENRWAAFCLIAIAATMGAGCGKREKSGIQVKLAEQAFSTEIPVEVLRLKAGDFTDSFMASGRVEAWDEVTVSSETSARVTEVAREIGDEIERGDALVRLDESSVRARIGKIEAEIARATTQLEKAHRDLDRQKNLFAEAASAQSVLDDASSVAVMYQNELAAAQADLEMAKVDLAKHVILSPHSGTISQRYVAAGEYVTPGVKLYDLVLIDNVKFVFSLSEMDIPRVRLGETLPIDIDAYPGRQIEGVIAAISPAGSAQTRTFRVEAQVKNEEERQLRPAMSGRARVARAQLTGVFIVPEEAVMRAGSENFLYLAASGDPTQPSEGASAGTQAGRRAVGILASVGPRVVVQGELADGDLCIILGQHAVNPDSTVRVRRIHDEIPEVQFD